MPDYAARCNACGATLAPDAAYCGSCGSPRTAAPVEPQHVAPAPPEPPIAEAQPSAFASSVSAPLPDPYSPPAQADPPVAEQIPSTPAPYPPVTGPMSEPPAAVAPPPPAYGAPAGNGSNSGQYPPPTGYEQPGQYPSAPRYPPFAQAPQPGYPPSGQYPPAGYPQSGQYPPPAYGAPGFGQPMYVQIQQQPSNAGPIVAEVILGLFGIFGVGWLIGGKTAIGGILLGASALWWVLSIVTIVLTIGLGALCIYPLDIAFIVASSVSLGAALRRR